MGAIRMKQCRICNEEKSFDEFYKNIKSSDGRQYRCIPCTKLTVIEWQKENPEKYNEKRFKYLKSKYASRRDKRLLKEYGINQQQYNSLFSSQNGMCAVCCAEQITLSKPLYVDHDHLSGLVRGLLCQHCNTGIGMMRESIDLLKKAISYLERSIDV